MPPEPQFSPRQAEPPGWTATPRFCLLAVLAVAAPSCLGYSGAGSPAEPESFNTKTVLDLTDGRKVEYAYCSIANTGLALLDARGKEVWRTTCNALNNVDHSKYRHRVTVEAEGNRLKVTSRASGGTFMEWL